MIATFPPDATPRDAGRSATLALTVLGSGPSRQLAVGGEIDACTAPQLRAALDDLLACAPVNLRVDLGRVSFCDCSGLHVLVAAHRRALAGGGRLCVLVSGRTLPRLLELTGLEHVLDVQRVAQLPHPR